MVDQPAQTAAPAEGATVAATQEACDVIVTRRAKAGLMTIAVAIIVAVVVLAGAGATLLITGLIPLSGLERRIAQAIEDKLGRDWKVEAAEAELGRIDGRSQLRVRQVSFRHANGATIRAPEAVLRYEPLALLRGEIRLVSVDLRGVNVRLGVTNDGALIVNADAAPAETPATPVLPDPGHWDAFTGVMSAITTLAQGDGLLGALETAGMNGARLSLVDPAGRVKASFEDVEIRLTRKGEGATRLTMKGRNGSRWKELEIDLSTTGDGTRRADIDIIRFEPSEVAVLAFGTGGVAIDGLALKGNASLTQAPDGKRSLSAEIDLLPGTIRFPDSPIDPIVIDSARLVVSSGDDLGRLQVREVAIQAGATRLKGSGSLQDENGAWRVRLTGAGAISGATAEPPIAVETLTADLRLDPYAGEARIDGVSIRGPAIAVEGAGVIQRVADGLKQKLSIKATDSDARAILAMWPPWTSPDLHRTLSDQIRSGRVASLQVDLDLAALDHAALVRGIGSIPDASLTIVVDAAKVRFQPGPGLPPLIDVSLSGKATGRVVQLAIDKAVADLGQGRQLTLSEGSFTIADSWPRRPLARVAFRSTGSMEALASLFAFPAFKEFSLGQFDPAAIRGASDLKTVVTLPMADDLKPGEVVVQSAGTLTGVASDTILGTEKLDGGTLNIVFDRSGLVVRGDARVGGDRGQIEIRQNSKGQGEATLTLPLDNAARQKRGLGPDSGLSGPVTAKVVKPLGRGSDGPPKVEIDLTKAAIEGPVPGLSKPAGRAGRVTFTYVADSDGPDFDDFVFDAAPVLIRGKIELNKQNAFESATLSQFRLSPGDNLKVDAKRDGNLTKVLVRGAVADMRPFIRDLQNAPGPPARGDKSAAKGGDLDLDLDVPILTGFNNEVIANGQLKLSKRNGDTRSLSFQGRIGRADVSVRQGRQGDGAGPLVVQSENGGALLRFVDLYRKAYGGDLTLNLGPGETRQSGELLFRNFVVRDEPALRRVVSEQSTAALAGDRAGSAPAAPRIDVGQVAFTKLRAEFTRSASRLDVSDMVIWGQQVGFTLQGNVDYGRDRVDIGGTYVPGYAFNNAFAQVPVVGAILGGGSQYGGLFAVNFRISGAASAPTMTINPLSALAPGILRRFVDPLGGAPERPPIQPEQQPGQLAPTPSR